MTEPVGGKDDGSLIFKQQKGNVEAYYRYRSKAYSERTIFISRYSRIGNNGLKLDAIREKA